MDAALVRFDLPYQKNRQSGVFYNSPCASIDDASVARLFNQSLQPDPTPEQIHYAKIILRQFKDARNFYVEETQENQTDEKAGLAIVIAFILAVIFAPLLVILGMHNRFLLKSLYATRSGQGFKDFAKMYTKIGIGLYALVAVLIAAGAIFEVTVLTTIGVFTLIFGGIAYLIVSLILTKKYVNQ